MLTSVELTNYRGHAHTTVPLSRFTLLVGDNAVGKSSVLEAVNLVSTLFKSGATLHDVFKDAWDLRWLARWTSEAPSIRLRSTSPDGDLVISPKLRGISLEPDSRHVWHDASGNTAEEPLSRLWNLSAAKISAFSLQPAMQMLSSPSMSNDSVPALREDGFGLPTFIAYLRLKDLGRYHRLIEALRSVVPSVVDLEFERVRLDRQVQRPINVNGQVIITTTTDPYIADELRLKFADGAVLPAHAASEGTLMALALLAVLHGIDPPDVLLLDDIDRGLHPRAQGELVRALRAALETAPGTQIIATSHSPYLVDHFSADEVVVLGRDTETQHIIARRLSEHPDERLRKAMTAGEFLNVSGWYWP